MGVGTLLLATCDGELVAGAEGAGEEPGTDEAGDEAGTDGAEEDPGAGEEAGTDDAEEAGPEGAGDEGAGTVGTTGVVEFLAETTDDETTGADPDGMGNTGVVLGTLGLGGVFEFPGAVPMGTVAGYVFFSDGLDLGGAELGAE